MNKLLNLCCIFIAVLLYTNPVPAEILPKGMQYDLLQARCTICHSVSLVTAQRLTLQKWQSEVNKMINWGAPLTADEASALALYLSKHLGPDRPLAKPPLVGKPANAWPVATGIEK